MIFLNIVLVALICIVINYLVSYQRRRLLLIKTINALPGPKPLPLIGNALYFLRCDHNELLQKALILVDTYPSPFRLKMGNKTFVVISDPDNAKIVLHSCLDKSTMYKFLHSLVGNGLVTAPVSTWTIHRKMITRSFNTSTLKSFFDTFVTQALKLADDLAKAGLNGKKIELLHYILLRNFIIAFDNIMDTKLESYPDEIQIQLSAILTRFKTIFMQRLKNPLMYHDTIFNVTTLGREIQKYAKFLHSLIHEMMQRKICSITKLDVNKSKKEITPRKKFMDIIIDAFHNGYGGKKLKQQESINEIVTMLVAASDTSTITMNFAIFMLANFPEIQEKVYQELLKICGSETSKSSPIKYEDLQYMDYLDRVIKETLRLFPVFPAIARYVTEDLKLGQYVLPRGTEIAVIIFAMHRDEKYWPNPLIFDPDRFLPENVANRHPYCYMPFSSGPRNCIGMRYGMMSLKIMIATLVRTFVFKVDKSVTIDEIKININFEIDTIEPLKVKIEKRNV